jgi:hypothetical protein
MKHVKLFEQFVNEMFANNNKEQEFFDVLRIMRYMGVNFDKAVDIFFDESEPSDPDETPESLKAFLKGGKLYKDLDVVPSELHREEDFDGNVEDVKSWLEDMMKKGYKFYTDVDFDGYLAILLSKKPFKFGDFNVKNKLDPDKFIETYYG